MCDAVADLMTEGSSLSIKRNKKINTANVNWISYEQIASNEIDVLRDSFLQMVNEPSQTLVNSNVNKLSAALYKAAKTCSIQQRRHLPSEKEEICEIPFQHILEKSNEALSRYLNGTTGAQE